MSSNINNISKHNGLLSILPRHNTIINSRDTREITPVINLKKIENRNTFRDQNEKLKQILIENDKDSAQQLIEELQKPAIQRTKKSQVKNLTEKDEWSLVYLLKKIPGFLRFMMYNGIDDNTLRLAVDNFGYTFVEKGEYVFREGEISKRFYGIIKGKVSIRVRKKDDKIKNEKNHNYSPKDSILISPNFSILKINETRAFSRKQLFTSIIEATTQKERRHSSKISILSQPTINAKNSVQSVATRTTLIKKFFSHLNIKLHDHEEERIQLNDGMCFGEWALLYNEPRRASVYTIENTHLFFLDKDTFDTSFSKCLYKAENERKNFLFNIIPLFSKIPKHKFEEFYRRIVAQFYKKNDIIYKEKDKAACLYIIYQGECYLKRDITKPYKFIKNFNLALQNENPDDLNDLPIEGEALNNATNKKDQDLYIKILRNSNFQNILRLDRGDVGGLEVSAGLEELNHTLVSSSDNTVILKINVHHLAEYRAQICSYFLQLYIEKEQIIETFVKSHRNLQKKMKIHYRTFSGTQNFKYKEWEITNKQKKSDNLIIIDDNFEEKELEMDREKQVKLYISSIQQQKPKEISNQFKISTIECKLSSSRVHSPISDEKIDNTINAIQENKAIKLNSILADYRSKSYLIKSKEQNKKERYKDSNYSLSNRLHKNDKESDGKQSSHTKYYPNNISNTPSKELIANKIVKRENSIPFKKQKEPLESSGHSSSDFKLIRKKRIIISNDPKKRQNKTLFTFDSGLFDLPMVSLK